MLSEFLSKNQETILAMTAKRTLELAGARPSSDQLKRGLPIFYNELKVQLQTPKVDPSASEMDKTEMAKAAHQTDEVALTVAAGRPEEVKIVKEAELHGVELLRMGFTLSHAVHAYSSMCQAITELAAKQKFEITASEFRDLNRYVDVAMAGAVTGYQTQRDTDEASREVEHIGFLAHELRNALTSVNISVELMKKNQIGFSSRTGQILVRGLKRIGALIDRSLVEVRLRVDANIHVETVNLLEIVNQILVTAETEAQTRGQILEIKIDPDLKLEADQQLVYSAISNLIQNALKYTRTGGKIQVRGRTDGEQVIVEVEDECGGLPSGAAENLFKPYVQQGENKKGIGLGLTIAQRAIALNNGFIEVSDLPGKGCVFKITLPKEAQNAA